MCKELKVLKLKVRDKFPEQNTPFHQSNFKLIAKE